MNENISENGYFSALSRHESFLIFITSRFSSLCPSTLPFLQYLSLSKSMHACWHQDSTQCSPCGLLPGYMHNKVCLLRLSSVPCHFAQMLNMFFHVSFLSSFAQRQHHQTPNHLQKACSHPCICKANEIP